MTARRSLPHPPLHIDFETRSPVDLQKAGAYLYFDDPDTDVWCAAYCFGNEEPRLWFPYEPVPSEICMHISDGGLVVAWNANFERIAWRQVLGPRYGWPVPALEQYRCAMAQAYAMGLPGALETAALALGLNMQKDQSGYRLMLQMSRPRAPRKGEDPNQLYWWDDADRIKRLADYCLQDVRTEVAAYNRLPPLRDTEQQIWFLDQRINDRGVYVDRDFCESATRIVKDTTQRINAEMRKVTGDAVRGISNVAELAAFCRANGVDAESVAKDQIIELLVRDDLPPAVRRALELRQEGAKTSVAKIQATLARRQHDGRMRGNLQYHGAGPGRWAARGAQLQNLPRPTLPWPEEWGGDLSPVIDDLRRLSADDIEMLYGPPLTVVSDCLRGVIAGQP